MKTKLKTKQWLVMLTLILLWSVLAAFIEYRSYLQQVSQYVVQQRAEANEHGEEMVRSIRSNVHYLSGVSNMLAQLVRVNKATAMFGAQVQPSSLPLETRKAQWTQQPDLNDLSRYLSVVQSNLNIDMVFLTNAAGDGIASSNWNEAGSPIGTNYAARDWFKLNKIGKLGMQYAMGKTTHVAGLYFATPVMQGGKFTGSVITKIDAANLTFLIKETDAYITDANGVIILARDPALLLKAVPNASVFGMSAAARLERYQRVDFTMLPLHHAGDSTTADVFVSGLDQHPYLLSTVEVPEFGLSLYVERHLERLGTLQHYALLRYLLLLLVGSGLILTFTAMAFYVREMRRAKLILQDSEDRYRTLVEWIPQAIVVHRAGKFIYANPVAVQLFGAETSNALIGTELSQRVHPDSRLAVLDALAEHRDDDLPALLGDKKYLKLDGSVIELEMHGCAILYDGEMATLMVLNDITLRNQAALLEQKRVDKLEAIYHFTAAVSNAQSLAETYQLAMDLMLQLIRADRVGVLLYDNMQVIRFIASRGLSAAYIEGYQGYAPWAENDANPHTLFVSDIAKDERFARYRESIEAEGVRALAFVPLLQHGRLLGKFILYFDQPHEFDVSELQLANTIATHVAFAIDRKIAEQQFADIFEFAPDAILMTDMAANITLVNLQAERLFGYAHEELIGKPIDVLIPSDNNERRDFSQRFIRSALHPRPMGQTSSKNLRGIARDGRIFSVEVSLNQMDSQQGRMIVAAVRDVSGRQMVMEQLMATANELEHANVQVEQERALLVTRVDERTRQLQFANAAKDSFLATMSHEIRTPLGGLLGMMELLSVSALNEQQTEMIKAARLSGLSLLRIVDDILDWSKIEAGKLVIAPRITSLSELLKNVVRTYAQLASAKGIQLNYRFDDALSAAHSLDPLRVSQILNNFTSNAIKFTAQGTVEVSVELLEQQGNHELIRFAVKDSGAGISSAHQARLFEEYEQASVDTSRMYGGTGLGLAICRRLADLMDGTIGVESTLEVGSTFFFTLRVPVASHAAQRDLQLTLARADDNEPEITPLLLNGRAVSVLVVDDHPVNRMLLRKQLELLGAQVDLAAYGIVALALWQTGRFDILITDCHMPEMDGYELTRSIREIERHDARAAIPIIAWTANVLEAEGERCKEAGMDDLLTKPTELQDLRAMLLKWLPGSSSALSLAQPASPSQPVLLETAAPAAAILDVAVLCKIAPDVALQLELLHEFKLENRNDIAALEQAMQQHDALLVARSAHRIKGAARMVGALQLAELLLAMEQAAKQNDVSSARELLPAVQEAVSHLELAIAQFSAGHRAGA
ncbi:MAG: hypothetical protein RL358_57 [Pseudomonadota bacterium]